MNSPWLRRHLSIRDAASRPSQFRSTACWRPAAGEKIQKAIALIRDSGQVALVGQFDALLVDSGTAPVADADAADDMTEEQWGHG